MAVKQSVAINRSLSAGVVEDPRSAPFHFDQSGIHPGGLRNVEGLLMSAAFSHNPVMLNEIVEWFAPVPVGVIIDATLGGAGHSAALLEAHPQLKLLGLDQDEVAINAATERLAQFGDRVKIVRCRFDDMATAAEDVWPNEPIVGVLFDLGVSSPQLDVAERGFSYRQDGPLDMRMDQRQALSAATVVNEYDVDTLTDILREGGEEKFARRIAKAIEAQRPLSTTNELAEVVRGAIPAPARRRPGDPAKRSFQAIRLEVNKELDVLESALDSALDLLAPGGRCVVLAYHSGEDRLVKQRFFTAAGLNEVHTLLPIAPVSTARFGLLARGSRKAGPVEKEANSRSDSARLRGIEALPLADNGTAIDNNRTNPLES